VPHRRRPSFWIGTALGWGVILFGLRGVLHHSLDTRPSQLVRFWIGGALAHDLLLAPLVLAVGVGLARLVGGRWRATVQRALILCGPLALFAYPEVRGYGRVLRNPTSLPHNYATNLLLVLAVIVAASGARTIAAWLRLRMNRPKNS
jgi:hypothetical protein